MNIKTESEETNSFSERWNKSRSGAWAGRGFHYQYLFSLLILVRQWAGLAPSGSLVPEGLEDCVVELTDNDIWIQVKSKKSGLFSETKVNSVLSEVKNKLDLVETNKPISIAVVIEQPCSDCKVLDINDLFKNTNNKVISCNDPGTRAAEILLEKLDVADILIEGLVSDLYKYIADTADSNAAVSYENRIRIPTTEIERRITERLKAEDPSVIDSALLSNTLTTVDFRTPVVDSSFYHGMKAKVGHVVSGQILRRDYETKDIAAKLQHHRHLLITGQSGAGKSSLVWLVAESLSGSFRWFQINQNTNIKNANEIVTFIASRLPHKSSPIALVFDEVGSINSDLWNQLVNDLRGFPDVYLLGSIRFEDVSLITNQFDTKLISTSLNEKIAKNIWEQLKKKSQTTWEHWKEPFEKSKGLMLEYVHILTQGERLATLIKEQISQREKEKREAELSIIRAVSIFNFHGGEIEVKKLFNILGLAQADASKALKRLLNEHIVTEARSGILGGLHRVRSKALADAVHDEVVFQTNETIHRYISTVTTESMPHVIRSIYNESNDEERIVLLKELSETLANKSDLNLWVATFTGLGLATLEKETNKLVSVLNEHNVQPSLWSLASMFAVTNTEIPEIPNKPRYEVLRSAILEYRELPKYDLRAECFDLLPDTISLPKVSDLEQTNSLLSCFVPIAGGEPLDISFSLDITINGQPDIWEIANLLSTAHCISPKLSEDFVSELGGEEVLFSWMSGQIPWLTKPTLEKGKHGRTVRADWFSLSNEAKEDLNQKTVEICETLIALSPKSEAAASDALDPSGEKLGINNFQPYSKNMPRENIPGKSEIAWNVAYRQIILSHTGNESLTDYVREITPLVRETEKILRFYTEKWIRNITIKNPGEFADKVNALNQKINDLAYTESNTPSSTMHIPAVRSGEDDMLVGGCLSGILTNLLDAINTSTGKDNKQIAIKAGDLSSRLKEQIDSPIWRTSLKPPKKEITDLIKRLEDISSINHELALNPTIVTTIVNIAKKGSLGKAVHSAGLFCLRKAQSRLNKKLKKVEEQIKVKGFNANCRLRPSDNEDTPYWPSKEIAILVNISDFTQNAEYFEATYEVASNIIKEDWKYCIVPVVNDQVIADLALSPPSDLIPTPLPDFNFKKEWQDHIDITFFEAKFSSNFDNAMKACNNLSAIIACRDIENLHAEENNLIDESISSFKDNKKRLDELYDERETEIIGEAIIYLENSWDRFIDEFELAKTGEKSDAPLYKEAYQALSGELNENIINLGAIRMLLIQEESSYLLDGQL